MLSQDGIARDKIRDTCICVVPSSAAISRWGMSWRNRIASTDRSRLHKPERAIGAGGMR